MALPNVVVIVSMVSDQVGEFVASDAVFEPLFEISLVATCGFFKSTVAMEESFFIESSLILVTIHALVPGEDTRSFDPVDIVPLERMGGTFFLSLSMEEIVFETTIVIQLRTVFSLIALGFVVNKFTIIVRTVAENVSSLSVSFSISEVTDVKGIVLFVKFAKTVWHILCLIYAYFLDLTLVDLVSVLSDDHVLDFNFTEKF